MRRWVYCRLLRWLGAYAGPQIIKSRNEWLMIDMRGDIWRIRCDWDGKPEVSLLVRY